MMRLARIKSLYLLHTLQQRQQHLMLPLPASQGHDNMACLAYELQLVLRQAQDWTLGVSTQGFAEWLLSGGHRPV